MEAIDAIWLTGMALCALFLVRNRMVFHWQMRALDEARDLSFSAIDAGTYGQTDYYAQIPDYYAQVLDLTQWRYRSPFEA